MFVKYFVSDTFDKDKFKDILIQQYNVPCAVVADGLIIERDTLNDMHSCITSEWVLVNIARINSKLHTREATPEEYIEARQERYWLWAYSSYKDEYMTAILKSDSYNEIRGMADEWLLRTGLGANVVDNYTGEIIYSTLD